MFCDDKIIQVLSSCCTRLYIVMGVLFIFSYYIVNPVALRKAKIVCNFWPF